MLYSTNEAWPELVNTTVKNSGNICIAVDRQLGFIALNDIACTYLKFKETDLLGKAAIQVFPEIVASRNHRNILKALSGIFIQDDLIESRKGDILKTTYTPVVVNNEVKAVIMNAVIHLLHQ